MHRPLVVLGFLHQQPRGSGTSHVALRASFSASPPRGHATCGHGLLPTRRSGAHEGPSFLLGGELLEAGGREPVHLLLAFRPATQRAGSEAGPVRFPEHLRQRNSARALPGAVDTRLPALAHRVEHTAALGDKTGVAEERDEPPQHSAAPPPSAPPPRPAAPAPGGLHTRRRWALRRRHSRPHMRRSGCTRAPILRMREGRERERLATDREWGQNYWEVGRGILRGGDCAESERGSHNIHKYLREGAKGTELDSFHWCPESGQEAVDADWSTGGPLWIPGALLCCADGRAAARSAKRLRGLLADLQKLMLGTLLCVPPGAGVRSDCPRGPCQPLLILWCVVCDSVVTQVSAWKVVFAALEIFLPMQLERITPSFCLIKSLHWALPPKVRAW